ncbi:carbon dioxide concentrating mechanism/carboxysome shell protein [Paenibacillus elgii]|uniref:Carbon dioxide concentrating mechanism/carboxysome shell protein n=1 Tax=Paenibacillus elgii TaxID=189691 RepID=A0A2T6FWF9_9BACL|nr:BMC domain-containing protein [Paenibacillus elgii]PUA36248.1 carbon dioxide concentrating mechanism/carboxysome shell protein [Paenibacillus elgii]
MTQSMTALGLIETIGVPALIAAADAAAKTADVRVMTFEKADAGLITVYIVGDVASVRAAVEAGGEEARRVGKLVGTHVIPRPDLSVSAMLESIWRKNAPAESKPADDEAAADEAAELSGTEGGESAEALAKLSLQQLRELARTTPGFPLNASGINTAAKAELIRLLTEKKD